MILKEKIDHVKITRDRELLKNLEREKTGIIDVKATFDNKTKVNIEMQIENRYNMNKRSFFYLSKLYSEGFEKGIDYESILKVISINIIAYNQFEKNHCHSVFTIKDEENNDNYYRDVMEIHYLELKKAAIDDIEDERLLDWLKFIKADDDEVVKTLSEKNKDIYKASEKLEELSSDEEVRSLAENRAKYLSDYTSDTNGACRKGVKQGIEQGATKEKKATICKFISRLKFSEEEIRTLMKKVEEIDDIDVLTRIEDLFFDGNIEAVLNLLKIE